MINIEWTRAAITDVKNLRDYIAHDSETYAERFVQKIVESVERVASFPYSGRKVPESDDERIREVLFQNYRVMYRVEAERIVVLMVIHGARDLSQIVPKPWEIG
jgi:plasmid stabilization system protein ParE